MTLSQKYNQVKSAVITACPEVMKLSFGQNVLFGEVHDTFLRSYYTNHFTGGEQEGYEFLLRGLIQKLSMDNMTILGHPITISHVLRAIGDEYAVDGGGNFIALNSGYQYESETTNDTQWNLSQDTLDWHLANRPEVIEFLYNILK